MVDFAKLKAMSGKKSLDTLTQELNKITNNDSKKGPDERFWQPTVDKAGNGYAVIRFLPAPEGEDVPFVRIFSHGFQGPTGIWYIENSLMTLGKEDPVAKFNTRLWNSVSNDDAEERKQVRKQKRRLHFYSNIYVEQDPGNPSNEGKVFVFKYGKKIFDKINEAINPQFQDEEPMNPFDFWSGAPFKLKIRQVEGYRNYDKSEFDKSRPLFEDDDRIQEVYGKLHSLQEFLKPANFKTYAELETQLYKVLDTETPSMPRAEELKQEPKAAPKAAPKSAPKAQVKEEVEDDQDDSLEFFKNLAK